MKSYKRDFTKNLEEDIDQHILGNSKIVEHFHVAPLDQAVQDWNTPQIFVSQSQLFFAYDDVIEEYNLPELEIAIYGDTPRFDIWQILIEPNYFYNQDDPTSLSKIKDSETLVKFVMNEPKQVTKEFVLRISNKVGKNYQNWAMTQLIVNVKNGGYVDTDLQEITSGQLLSFNQKTVSLFLIGASLYILLRIFTQGLFPSLLSLLIDIIFGIILIVVAVWTYKSYSKNFKRYKAAYLKYYS